MVVIDPFVFCIREKTGQNVPKQETEALCDEIIKHLNRENKGNIGGEVNRWTIEGIVAGDLFVDGVHEQGTEVKAITYSEMQIHVAEDGSTEVYVIVDI